MATAAVEEGHAMKFTAVHYGPKSGIAESPKSAGN